MKIAIQGCCHGQLHKIYQSLANLEMKQNVKVDLLLVCGDFQAVRNDKDLSYMACPVKYRHMGDFNDYYTGASVAPVPTIFIGGNHEASNLLQELYYGGWVCSNIYYLGHSGVVNFGGLRIGGVSGIYYPRDYRMGHYEKSPFTHEMIRSAYHYREFEIKKLMKICQPIDIFMSHEWPTEIYNHGNVDGLLRIKPYFKKEIASNELGAKPLQYLMDHLKPKNWFAAHLHVGFDAVKEFPDGSKTKFVALDKCIPNRDYLRIMDFPLSDGNTNPKIEYDAEWLAILKESEQFMNYNRQEWIIPSSFSSFDIAIRKEIENKLSSGKEKIIYCPKVFDGTEINQTRMFKHKFLNTSPKDWPTEANPEEIELDL